MKFGKFLLGAAAMGLTVASGFAFKMHKKFNLTQLYTSNTTSGCRLSNPGCYTLGNHSSQQHPCNFITYFTKNTTDCVLGNGHTWATTTSIGHGVITLQ
jgi:hypothetical protein